MDVDELSHALDLLHDAEAKIKRLEEANAELHRQISEWKKFSTYLSLHGMLEGEEVDYE